MRRGCGSPGCTRRSGISAHSARWNYAVSGAGIVDLLAVLPFWFAFMLPIDFRVILVLRFVRFLKLTRYSPAMRSLLEALYQERRALFGCVVILIGTTLIAASLMHLVEGHVQPDKLGTIPDAMWWAIVTLGTIGYGDVVPVTVPGKLIAGVTIFLGLIMVALPVGIIANAFCERDSPPRFRRDLGDGGARAAVFRARCPRGRRHHAASARAAGRARRPDRAARRSRRIRCISSPPARSRSSCRTSASGSTSGTSSARSRCCGRARRSANVTAISRTSLLVLDAHDFHALMERDPRLSKRVHEVVRARLGRELVTPRGDLVTEEIDEAAQDETSKPTS